MGKFDFSNNKRLLKLLYGNEDERDKAFKQMWLKTYKYCFTTGKGMGLSRAEIEDCRSEAFMKVLKAVENRKININPFVFLKTTIRNTMIDFVRRKKKDTEKEKEMILDPGFVSMNGLPEPTKEKIWMAMNTLVPKHNKLLIAQYVYGQSQQELADELGTTRNSIKTETLRARKAFQVQFNLLMKGEWDNEK